MVNYSITLNFFLSKNIVNLMGQVEIKGNIKYNWTNSKFCHSTVKAICLCDELPSKEILNKWIKDSEDILKSQKPFEVSVKGISKFPTAVFANIVSDELVELNSKLSKVLPDSQPQFKFTPHASLAMVSEDVEVISNLNQDFGTANINEIQLMIWNLNDLNDSKIHHKFKLF